MFKQPVIVMDLRQFAVDKYETRESLIQQGVWKGELYKTAEINKGNRGWLWKSLVIDDDPGTQQLLRVPILLGDDDDGEEIRKVQKPNTRGIRRLTPVSVDGHPLDYQRDQSKGQFEDETDDTTLREKLEIIDLDLSRLMLDDIFQEPKIHAKMRQIMYNFLVNSGESKLRPYKQGYHEILGIIFLQLYDDQMISDDSNSDDMIMMNQVLCIFEKLMEQMTKWFYNEQNLIKWDEAVFQPILKNSCPALYELMCSDQNHTSIIWLIRWTRLLFIRELPRDYTLIIWDHVLTFTYPLDTLVACIIVALLINNYQILMDNVEDHNDLVEMMLHYSVNSNSMIDCVELCRMSGNLCELWYSQDFDAMKLISDTFLKIKFNIDVRPVSVGKIDPNRRRLEEKLRKRVKQTLLTREAK